MLNEHYEYMKHIVQNVLQIESENSHELNYFIYLLDKDNLPINNYRVKILKNYKSFKKIIYFI